MFEGLGKITGKSDRKTVGIRKEKRRTTNGKVLKSKWRTGSWVAPSRNQLSYQEGQLRTCEMGIPFSTYAKPLNVYLSAQTFPLAFQPYLTLHMSTKHIVYTCTYNIYTDITYRWCMVSFLCVISSITSWYSASSIQAGLLHPYEYK